MTMMISDVINRLEEILDVEGDVAVFKIEGMNAIPVRTVDIYTESIVEFNPEKKDEVVLFIG